MGVRPDRQDTTRHEAGHAVVAHALGWHVHGIVIENFQDGFTLATPRADWRDHVLVLLAGGEAEDLRGLASGATSNVVAEREAALRICQSELGATEGRSEWERLRVQAAEMITSRFEKLEALAGELNRVDDMSSTRVHEILGGGPLSEDRQ